jgi:broad specificity phosphatase PhoE
VGSGEVGRPAVCPFALSVIGFILFKVVHLKSFKTVLSAKESVKAVELMPKQLCLIRHGQGHHNPRNNPLALEWLYAVNRPDARLTGKGRRQAEALQPSMEREPFDMIVVSPLTRTIETATRAFAGHSAPFALCHLMCERALMPADAGVPKEQLVKKHPHIAGWHGFHELPERFWPETGEQDDALAARVAEFKRWVQVQHADTMALVGHSAFFRVMTGMDRKLDNCEAVWFVLEDDSTMTLQ